MADHHHRHKGSIYGLNTVVGLGQKMASSKYEHKSYDAFKVSPKNSWALLACVRMLTNFYPFTLRLAKRLYLKYRQPSRGGGGVHGSF